MITNEIKSEILNLWKNYSVSDKTAMDTKGNPIKDIDESRIIAIEDIKSIINSFMNGESNISVFKTALDSYNKRHNFWGFTAIKGQMFFNQLVRMHEEKLNRLTELLKSLISEPKDINEALKKINELEALTKKISEVALDKRKVPNPSSIGYFLSYFWQIHSPQNWPIMYTSLIKSFMDLGIWKDGENQIESYKYFYELNNYIKSIISEKNQKDISNWDVEHCFWFYQNKTDTNQKVKKETKNDKLSEIPEKQVKTSFELNDYLPPMANKLIDVGNSKGKSASSKGSDFEKLVSEIFKMLDFQVEFKGQGSGRNPDAILKVREENTAFLVDAKAYSDGYSLGIDDRAIKEYISHYCPLLSKEGYKKIGFIIVSNSFKSDFDSFINDITWNTDIRRFILVTSEALQYLLAYKIKDNLSSAQIVESIISCGNLITTQNIIDEFDDV
jgi:hypothetical protein